MDQSARNRSRPATTAWPSTTPCTPRPSVLANDSTGQELDAAFAGAGGDGLRRSGARTRPRAIRRGAAPASLRGVAGGDDVDEGHLAGRHGAGLVEHDGVDRAGRLEDLGALDQDAELRAPAGADHQRGRRGQPEGAWAGDDQHRDRGGERGRRVVGRRCGEPEAEGREGERDDDRDEDRRDTVGQPLHLGLAGLGLLDQAADLGERGVGADASRADDETTAGVDRRARHDRSPGATSTGTGSPVSNDASIADVPSSTMPSVAIFSPGRTTNRSPTSSSSTGIRTSVPSRSTATSLAPSSSSAFSAAPERRLARASK